jgi:hypothetical protein
VKTLRLRLRVREHAAAREAGGAATRARLAGTHTPSPTVRPRAPPPITQHTTKLRKKIEQESYKSAPANQERSRRAYPSISPKRPRTILTHPSTPGHLGQRTKHPPPPQWGSVLPRRPHNTGRRWTSRVKIQGPGASAKIGQRGPHRPTRSNPRSTG